MNISLICTGKTTEPYVQTGMGLYLERLRHYCKITMVELEAGKGEPAQLRKKEGEAILKRVEKQDILVLLDEKGKEVTSAGFAELLKHHQNISTKNLIFAIGGAYGFSEEVYQRANLKLALSQLTFPHQLVRVIFLEQLYRGFTLIKGEKYHH